MLYIVRHKYIHIIFCILYAPHVHTHNVTSYTYPYNNIIHNIYYIIMSSASSWAGLNEIRIIIIRSRDQKLYVCTEYYYRVQKYLRVVQSILNKGGFAPPPGKIYEMRVTVVDRK